MPLITLDQSEYKRLDAKAYATEKRRLQIELLKLQEDVIKNNRKLCIVFEGRDTAGKSSTIKFFQNILGPIILIMCNLESLLNGNLPTGFKDGKRYFQKMARYLFLTGLGIHGLSQNQL